MIMTPERLAANRANSLQSTGPRTEAGKAISRRNAIKHGLTGEGIALPDEDAAAVEAAFEQHFDEMKPRTRAGAALVYQVAWATLKLQRFRQADAARTSQRILDAGHAFDDAQFARRDEAKAKLREDPEARLAALSRFKVGVEWVLDAWDALSCALFSEKQKNWRQPQYDLFEALTGRSPEFPSYHDSTMWNLAAKGDEGALDDPDLPGDSPAAKMQSARERLMAICEEEIARWEAMLGPATAATETARANAIMAARYDGSKEGLLAKKYEAATTREFNKALNDFKVVEAEFAEEIPAVEIPRPVETCAEVGSFLPGPDPGPEPGGPDAPELEVAPTRVARTFQIPISDPVAAASNPILASEAGESRRS